MKSTIKTVLDDSNSFLRRRERILELVQSFSPEWNALPDEFRSGDEIGFEYAGTAVRANVVFDAHCVTVVMTSPAAAKMKETVYSSLVLPHFPFPTLPNGSLFEGGREGGPATDVCIAKAKELLFKLFATWMVIYGRRDEIREKCLKFDEFAAKLHASEMARIAPLREKIKEYAAQSGEIKRSFKRGEMTEAEYVKKKGPFHQKLSQLEQEAKERGPFMEVFGEEMLDALPADNWVTFVESVIGMKLPLPDSYRL